MQDGKILQIVCTTMYIYLTLKSCTGLPGGSAVKSPPAYVGDVGTIPGLERSPGEGKATHPGIHAWEIPRTEEPGGL